MLDVGVIGLRQAQIGTLEAALYLLQMFFVNFVRRNDKALLVVRVEVFYDNLLIGLLRTAYNKGVMIGNKLFDYRQLLGVAIDVQYAIEASISGNSHVVYIDAV